MNLKIRETLAAAIAAVSLLSLSACLETSATSGNIPETADEGTLTPDSAPANDENSVPDEGELGTIIGNPNGKGVSSLTVKTLDASSSSVSALVTDEKCAGARFDLSPDGPPLTQKCHVTPQEFHFNVTAIYLVECADADGAAVPCTPDRTFTVVSRTAVYEGDAVDLKADTLGTALELDLDALSESKKFGGIQLVTNTIGQKFPSDDASDAGKIVSALRDKPYRICSSATQDPASACGHAEAQRGDLFVDLDGDGIFGYLDGDALQPGEPKETQTRPAAYDGFNIEGIGAAQIAFSGNVEAEYTDGSNFGGEAGRFAPILGFEEIAEIAPATAYDFTATIDVTDSFFFIDGNRDKAPQDVCVAAVAAGGCAEDDDPASVGVYDPYYDGVFLPAEPATSVTVSENAEDTE